MTLGKRLAVVGFVTAALLLATAAGSFSAMEADRGVSVDVAGDPDALLAIENKGAVVDGGSVTIAPGEDPGKFSESDVTLLTLTNQLAQDLTTLDVTVSEGSGDHPEKQGSISVASSLETGESTDVEADIECSSDGDSEPWTVDITASGPGVNIELTREVTVECERDVTTRKRVNFIGVKKVEATGTAGTFPVEATLVSCNPTASELNRTAVTFDSPGERRAAPDGEQLVRIVLPAGTVDNPHYPKPTCANNDGRS